MTSNAGSDREERIGHKLLSLLPLGRQATFRVKVTIHDVTNIPFQSGAFALSWKFKAVRNQRGDPKRKNSQVPTDEDEDDDTEAGSSRTSFDSKDDLRLKLTPMEKGKKKLDEDRTLTAGMMMPGGQGRYGQFLSPAPPPAPVVTSIYANSIKAGPSPPKVDDAQKGSTEFAPLNNHAVRWDHTVEVVVPFKIKRDSHELMPADLKLVLQEQALPTASVDHLHPRRFGLLTLNLAEYADRGPVMRRYLLRESQTNATLKLTIEATHVSGDKHYKVPELRRGQALTGVAGVLTPFTNFPDASSVSQNVRSSTPVGTRSPTPLSMTNANFLGGGGRPSMTRPRPSFAMSTSHITTSTAESVIELLFNPIPTSATSPSPFTYYVPSRPDTAHGNARDPDTATLSSQDQSVESIAPATLPAGWWAKLQSRKKTAAPLSAESSSSGGSLAGGWTDNNGNSLPPTPSN